MSDNNAQLSGFENFMYYAVNILTFGAYFMIKVAIKKAIIESKN